ncbi:MAG: putative addiction module antidote protein [Candidatus Margulisbacteria bacterium]|jgi:probable addiction module antidote protein|nr:putative addiction module antidote protein [Candidatus Margulisiibacteriota bacterium]
MLKTVKFDIYSELKTERDIKEYLEAAFVEAGETDDPGYITHALGVAAKARGMLNIARKSGVNRENLYRSLSRSGNPSFKTVVRVAKSLGYQFAAVPLKK